MPSSRILARTGFDGLTKAAAVLSIFAAVVHFGVTGDHFTEGFVYGIFFIVAATAQCLYGAALMFDLHEKAASAAALASRRRLLYSAGILGNGAIILLYVVTRTVGIPLGPLAGEVEAVGLVDLVSKATEVALIVVLIELSRRTSAAAGAS